MNDKSVVIQKFHAPQSAEEIKDQVKRIQEVMRGVMKRGTHYDKIPGTPKESLLKPGAEMLLTTFRIAVRPEVEDLSDEDQIRYRVHAHGVHMGTQVTVGEGVGECSSNEMKYKWRIALCQEEYDEAPEARRRIHWKKGYNGVEKVPQIRTEPADSANTILKMAKKRAEVDLCLTALACSDIFTQDMEDVPDNLDQPTHPKANQPPPRSTGGGGTGTATEKQVGLIRMRMNGAPFSETDLCVKFEIEALEALPFAKVNDVLAWIQNGGSS